MSAFGLTTPLRDLLTIPETRDASDFVLRLHEGVASPTSTLSDYVVTDAIASSLDDALALVERTLAEGKAKGTFIHGSFGSGKSHFMAVLHLLLTGNVEARKLPGLQETIARRSGVFNHNLLAIDYHLLGAESFEQALFTGYLNTVRVKHPDRLCRCFTQATASSRMLSNIVIGSATKNSSRLSMTRATVTGAKLEPIGMRRHLTLHCVCRLDIRTAQNWPKLSWQPCSRVTRTRVTGWTSAPASRR